MTELSSTEFREKIKGSVPLVVDFWAEWCMPCKIFAPVLEELSGEMGGKVEFCKVNVDESNDLAVEYNIASIPTIVVIKDGQEAARLVGVQPKDAVQELIEKQL